MHDDGLHHRRAMLRKLGQVAQALLAECQGADNPGMSGEETSEREIAAACLVRHAAQLEVQIRRA